MKLLKNLSVVVPVIVSLFLFVPHAFAAAPDGPGPWADSVVSTNQGLMKNGLPVPAIRSDPTSALGVAEQDTVDGHFFSLGFGGKMVLGFVNGISSGVFVFEETNAVPTYPIEKAKVEISENGTTWVNAGNVSQDGEVKVPDAIGCAKYVRLTDISNAAEMPDDIADGYDVDGVMATGQACTPPPDFPACESKLPTPGDKAHYTSGLHQIVGGALMSGSDDVYTLEHGNYLQCFCPAVGTAGIQTDWVRTDTSIPGWFFLNGSQWNLGNVTYAAKNVNFTCQPPQTLTLAKKLTSTPSLTPTPSPTPKLTSSPLASSSSTPGLKRLGGLNLDGYCSSLKLPGGSTPVKNDWICKTNNSVINMTNACRAQYNPTSVAKQDLAGNPYSWSCY